MTVLQQDSLQGKFRNYGFVKSFSIQAPGKADGRQPVVRKSNLLVAGGVGVAQDRGDDAGRVGRTIVGVEVSPTMIGGRS